MLPSPVLIYRHLPSRLVEDLSEPLNHTVTTQLLRCQLPRKVISADCFPLFQLQGDTSMDHPPTRTMALNPDVTSFTIDGLSLYNSTNTRLISDLSPKLLSLKFLSEQGRIVDRMAALAVIQIAVISRSSSISNAFYLARERFSAMLLVMTVIARWFNFRSTTWTWRGNRTSLASSFWVEFSPHLVSNYDVFAHTREMPQGTFYLISCFVVLETTSEWSAW